MKGEILVTENRSQVGRRSVASGWRKLVLLPLIAALATSYVTYTVARIEDKYLEGRRVFMDPLHYQLHLFHLWELSKTKSRFDLVLEELSVPAEDGNITQIAFRTIPIILLNPDWLKSPHAYLITSGFGLFAFLWMLGYTVYRRTNRFLYALASVALFCSLPGIYEPFGGMGAFWLDLTAGYLGGAAMLCLFCSGSGEKLVWLVGFAIFAACSLLSRFVTGVYLFVQAAPVLSFYLWQRWKRHGSFRRGVLIPVLLIGGILLLLVGWYLWKLTPSQAAYYTLYSYGYKDILGSAYQVLDTTQRFFGLNLLLFCVAVFVVYLGIGFRSASWRTLVESLWSGLSVGLFLTISCEIGESDGAMQYSAPILLMVLLCPFDWRNQQQRWFSQRPGVLLNALAVVILFVAGGTLVRDLNANLWRPPKPWYTETDRKTLTETLTYKIMQHFPDKVVGAYFDLLNEYAFVIAFERYGRFPRMFAPRAFDVRDQYLKLNYPGKSPEEFADIAWREASENCDVVLIFNDPATAFKTNPFDYGWCLNSYTETIASKMAETVRENPHWKKLFVVPCPSLPGGVAAYANLDRYPDATEIKPASQ